MLDPRTPDASRADAVRRHGGAVVVADRSHLDAARAVAPVAKPLVLDDLEPGPARLPPGTPVADDDVGEVLVTGDHLALGYLGDPERTAAKFHDGPAGRTSATGDRARQRADGVLAFAGRTDDVRKARGVLVDLAAVELALATLPGVETAAVVSHDRATGTGLTAFVTGPVIRPARVRADLADALPSAMVPARILAVSELPLTSQGKVDRKALSKHAEALSEVPHGEPMIHPTAVVGPDATFGEGVTLHPHVVVLGEVHVGDGTEVYPGAVIGKPPAHHPTLRRAATRGPVRTSRPSPRSAPAPPPRRSAATGSAAAGSASNARAAVPTRRA